MKQYLKALQYIMDNGIDREDRTGTGTRSVFTYQMRFDLQNGFPAMTTKKLAWLGVKSELLWMLEGSGDERRLAEIRYGAMRHEIEDKKTIWTANADSDYWKPNALYEGDLGRVYGVQWRDWKKAFKDTNPYVDQIANVITSIKEKPWDRRHIVSAWNPGEIDQMALPPCHMIFQFYVANNRLSCHMFQRSCDMFLGVPFNIASYALLTHMIAQVCNLDIGEVILTLGDAHIYNNHFDQVKEQLLREPGDLPVLKLNSNIKNIDVFGMSDIKLTGYNPQESIKAEMAV